jgi:hypothetical protein
MDDSLLLENRPLLRCEPEHGAVICLTCNNGYPLKRVSRHLTSSHHFPKSLYSSIIQSFEAEIHTEEWKDLSHPIDGSTPIEGLQVRDGYVCMTCGFRTTGDENARKHLKCGPMHRVHLQCWNRSSASKCWIVAPPPTPMHAVTADGPIALQTGMIHFLFIFYIYA